MVQCLKQCMKTEDGASVPGFARQVSQSISLCLFLTHNIEIILEHC